MKNAFNRLRSGMETLNLTMLLILNLFFMVFLLLAVCTVLVLAGVDEGFLYHDGQVELGGALTFVYPVCILIAVSMVVMIRMVFIHPLQRNIEAMKKLANGDFAVRVNHAEHGYVPREMVEFEQSFNKAAEELGGTEILRKDFINNFSHEFKTPIVSIAGFAKLLRRGNLTDAQKEEYLAIIEEESLRLAAMATNVMNLTKVENQTILTDLTTFNLSEQIRACVLLLEEKWSRKELDLDLEFPEYTIRANEELLKQVWINLLDNAIKYSPNYGEIGVRISEGPETLAVTITNYGPDIPKDKVSRIWGKFYQADESHSSEGNGIGLAVVKQVVQLHGGTATVDSGSGSTTFTVELPKQEETV